MTTSDMILIRKSLKTIINFIKDQDMLDHIFDMQLYKYDVLGQYISYTRHRMPNSILWSNTFYELFKIKASEDHGNGLGSTVIELFGTYNGQFIKGKIWIEHAKAIRKILKKRIKAQNSVN